MSAGEAPVFAPVKRGAGQPVFDAPWQAQLLAIADILSRSGTFTPSQWSEALGEELRLARDSAAPDTAQTYYEAALRALEYLVTRDGMVSAAAIAECRKAWEQAYLATPHGHPVKLTGH